MVSVDGNLDRDDIVDEYKITRNSALKSATTSAPFLTKIAVAVNASLSGFLGTRSTSTQLQALFHRAFGNLEIVVNKNSEIPSTYFLPVCVFIGKGITNIISARKL